MTPPRGEPRRALWLAHHDADHMERCAVVAGRYVCRRCLWLYPVSGVVAVAVATTSVPTAWQVAAMWVLPVPAVVEWVGEHAMAWRYRRHRQVAVSLLAAVALGVAFAIHARHPFAVRAVAPMTAWVAVCAVAWLVGATRRRSETVASWEAEFEAAERSRIARLSALVSAHGDEMDRRLDDGGVRRATGHAHVSAGGDEVDELLDGTDQ